jgi:filamentous hemagglutinin family protein
LQAALVLCFNFAPLVHANPTGEQVAAGAASFNRNGSSLTIRTSDRVIINWQDFSIGNGELTKFIQPSASSAALNRVVSGNPSSILGTLQANGQIFLINPNGILVGGGAVIDTGGFIASTLDVGNQQFLQGGNLDFTGNSNARIENQGKINAIGGDIVLIARHVENKGELNAPDGTVGLAAGTEVLLAQSGHEKIFVKPASGNASGTGIDNSGSIQAARAELKATGNLYALAINNSGVVRASGAVTKDGRVYLTAGAGMVVSSGTLSAKNQNGTGGRIQVTGKNVALTGQAIVDASGPNGGGEILIGGDYQGLGSIPNAEKTFVAGSVSITADAVSSGSGGKVIVWADDWTRFYGSVSARGGVGGGNGGFVEISGKVSLAFDGAVNVAAPLGSAGTVLFDPRDGTFQAAAGTGDGFLPNVGFAEGGTGTNYTFGEAAMEAITGNVVVQVSRHMVFSNGLVLNFNNQTAGERVAFQADGNVTFQNGAQVITQGADVWVQADANADGAGTLTLGQNSQVLSNGGAITLIANNFILNTSATPSLVNAGGSAVGINVARSRSSEGLSNAILNNNEIGRFQTPSGTLTLGQATTAGTDGLGTGAVTITNESITLGPDVTIPAANAASVLFIANNGITILNNQELTTGGPTTLNADADANGTGTFTTSGNTEVLVTAGTLTITAADAVLSPTGTFTANAGIFLQPAAAGGAMALNDAAAGFNLTAAELNRLFSTGTVTLGRVGGTGPINIAGLGPIDLSGKSFNLTLRGGPVSFNGSAITLADGKTMTFNTDAVGSTTAGVDAIIGGAGNLVFNTTGSVDLDTQVARVTATFVPGDLTIDNVGALNLGASTVTGTATLNATGNITQSGGISADTLVLSSTGNIDLDDFLPNLINTIGSVSAGGFFHLIDSAGGLDLDGPMNTGGRVEIWTLGGPLDINGDITAGDNITLRGFGVTQVAGSIVDSGSGRMTVDGDDGAVDLRGLLTTLSISPNAVFIRDTGTLALGNVTALNGTLQLGSGAGGDRIGGALTQNAGTVINVDNLTLSSASSATLANAGNLVGSIGSVRRGGAFSLNDSAGGIIINGPIDTGNLASDVTIVTAGGDLVLNGVIAATGAGNDVILVTNQNFINNTGAAAITTSGGGRYLVYSTDPALNTTGGLPFEFEQYSTIYPTPPNAGNLGNGFLYSIAAPVPPSPDGSAAGTSLLALFSDETDRYYRSPNTPANGPSGIYYDSSNLNAAPPNLGTDDGLDAAPPHGLPETTPARKTRNLTTGSSFEAFANEAPPAL